MAIKLLRTINTQSTLAVSSRLLKSRKNAWVISLENGSPGNDKDLLALICLVLYKYVQNIFLMFKKIALGSIQNKMETTETLET